MMPKPAFINQHFKNCVLSIDGRPAVHDRMRPDAGGHGSYERIAAHIRSFVAARGEPGILLCAAPIPAKTLILPRMSCIWPVWPTRFQSNRSSPRQAAVMKSGRKMSPALEAEYEKLAWLWLEQNQQRQARSIFSIS